MHRNGTNGSQMISRRPFRIFMINMYAFALVACVENQELFLQLVVESPVAREEHLFALHPCWQDLQSGPSIFNMKGGKGKSQDASQWQSYDDLQAVSDIQDQHVCVRTCCMRGKSRVVCLIGWKACSKRRASFCFAPMLTGSTVWTFHLQYEGWKGQKQRFIAMAARWWLAGCFRYSRSTCMCSHLLHALKINRCFSNWWWKAMLQEKSIFLPCTHVDRIYSLDLPSSIWRVERAKAKMHRNGSQMMTCRPFRIFKINMYLFALGACVENQELFLQLVVESHVAREEHLFALHPCWQDLQSGPSIFNMKGGKGKSKDASQWQPDDDLQAVSDIQDQHVCVRTCCMRWKSIGVSPIGGGKPCCKRRASFCFAPMLTGSTVWTFHLQYEGWKGQKQRCIAMAARWWLAGCFGYARSTCMRSHVLHALKIKSCFSNWWWKAMLQEKSIFLLCTHVDRIYSLDLPSSIWRVERAKAKIHRNGSQMMTCRLFPIFKINMYVFALVACVENQ